MDMNKFMVHCHLVVDINKERTAKYGYQTDTSGDSERLIMIV